MKSKADDAGIALEATVEPSVPGWLSIDAHRVRQVVINLLSKAIKFTAAGTIRLHLSYHQRRLKVEVADTGIRMNEETLRRVFQPFEQAEAGTARKYGGTGLGLSICKKLCHLMNGELRARSEPGVGSTFFFEIDAAPEVPPTTDCTEDARPSPLKLRVLVAVDTKVNQLVIRHFLSRLGAEAEIVDDGAKAVSAVEAGTYDLVLMDLQMPGVDGIEATKQIRALSTAGSDLPIIALTASEMAEQRQECLAAGMNDVLMKPLELEALRATLEGVAREPTPPT